MNSFILRQNLPNAHLIHPGSGHGAQFQCPALFVKQGPMFLDD